MWKILACLIVSAALMTGCGSDEDSATGSVTLLSPAEYEAAISANDVFLVNVHIPYEGEVEGTDAFIPFDNVEAYADELPADKSAPLYIYCRSGRMSAEATPDLQQLGYTNIIDLDGGMDAWEQAGLPLAERAS